MHVSQVKLSVLIGLLAACSQQVDLSGKSGRSISDNRTQDASMASDRLNNAENENNAVVDTNAGIAASPDTGATVPVVSTLADTDDSTPSIFAYDTEEPRRSAPSVCSSLTAVFNAPAIQIKTMADLKNMADGQHYVLANDIVLTGEWQASKSLYNVVLDGNGYRIRNLVMTKIDEASNGGIPRLGLFFDLNCTAIFNLKITDFNISAPLSSKYSLAAALAANADKSYFYKIDVKRVRIALDDQQSGYISAFVGLATATSKFDSITIDAGTQLSGTTMFNVSGLIFNLYGPTIPVIKNIQVAASIQAKNVYASGLVGLLQTPGITLDNINVTSKLTADFCAHFVGKFQIISSESSMDKVKITNSNFHGETNCKNQAVPVRVN